MIGKEFIVLNAFALKPFGGNPAAVFLDARGIPETQLQSIARQLNLIETVFAYPSTTKGVDYKLRYFTPLEEIPVAGHPTVATWTALAQQGLIDLNNRSKFVQETGAGKQEITVTETNQKFFVSMKQPDPTFTQFFDDLSLVAESIGLQVQDLDPALPIQGVNVGLGHVVIPVRNLEAIMRAKMNLPKIQQLCIALGMREAQLFTFETHDHAFDLFTRNFTPREGLEDPACGNGNGALAAYLAQTKLKDSSEFHLKVEQGHAINMPSLIEISVRKNSDSPPTISIAGSAVSMVEGRLLV